VASVVAIGQLSADFFCLSSHDSLKNTERALCVQLKDVTLQWLSLVLRWGRRVCDHIPLGRGWRWRQAASMSVKVVMKIFWSRII